MAKKKPAKDGPETSGPDDKKWEALPVCFKTDPQQYLAVLAMAIEKEHSIPTSALKPLIGPLQCLGKDGPLRARLDDFAKELSLKKGRGRPKSEVNFWRAYFYWCERIGNEEYPPLSHSEAITVVADEYENCDVSIVMKAVRAHPEAKRVAEQILAGIKRHANKGK